MSLDEQAMQLTTSAIMCAVLPHGESGAIARLLTPQNGLLAGYVRGGRSRRLRPVLQPGNLVEAEFRARTEAQLAALTLELTVSRAPLVAEPLAAAAIEWTCALAAVTLAEGHAYPAIHTALDGLLSAVEAAPSARGWGAALVRYELLLLAELGFGLDLGRCAATGATENLVFVSPKSGAAVSGQAGAAYADRMFALPPFLATGGPAEWTQVLAGLRITGHFIERDLLADRRRAAVLTARDRLVNRIARIVG